MKLCITAQGPTLDAAVDPRFGRAATFVLFDTATQEWHAVDNAPDLQAAAGAGVQSAQNVANAGAEVVLTGHCGPKAFRALSAAGIQVVTGVEGTVAEAARRYMAGDLDPTDAPDVEGHWAQA